MNYIETIREKIGTYPLIVCGCGCLIFNDKGQLLMQRRADDGKWGNPGGLMELGESIYDCVKREAYEETGLFLEEYEVFNIYSGVGQYHVYPNGDEVYIVNIVFKVKKYSGNLRVNDTESKELKFFDIDDLPTDVTGPFLQVKKDLQK